MSNKYTDEFKISLLKKLESGEIKSIEEARKLYNIGGKMTIKRWSKKYGIHVFPQKESKEDIRITKTTQIDSLLIALGRSYLRLLELENKK